MSRVTDFDKHVAKRIKELRAANGDASMAKLAKFLGITYQSYQAMERGEVSFRASTLSKLAMFYHTTIDQIVGEAPLPPVPNIGRISYMVDLMASLPPDRAAELVNIGTSMLRERVS